MDIEQASGDWIGLLVILGAIVAQAVSALRRGKPPTVPEPPARPRPQPRPPVQAAPRPTPTWKQEPVIPPRPSVPVPVATPTPAPTPAAVADPDAADLHRLLERLRQSDATRDTLATSERAERKESLAVGTSVTLNQASAGMQRLQSALRNRDELRRAIILSEALQPPLALRD